MSEKVIVFAHTPPPHHGQSQMVELMLNGLADDDRVDFIHVNCRLSSDIDDIGGIRIGKLLKLTGFCISAVAKRIRTGASTFYYIPSPPKRASLYRDWIVMILCRPFFRKVVFHWHAYGLGEWLETKASFPERWISQFLLGNHQRSLVLTPFNEGDALKLRPWQVEVVSNGIADPCSDFAAVSRKNKQGTGVQFLFLAHCSRDKGLFDALKIVSSVAAMLKGTRNVTFVIGGQFVDEKTRTEFDLRISQPDLKGVIDYRGYVSGAEKDQLLRESDFFLFPTFYLAESQPVCVIEAMAYGLPLVTTRWRGIPTMLPEGYPGLVDVGADPNLVAEIILARNEASDNLEDWSTRLREHFLENYTLERHLNRLADAITN